MSIALSSAPSSRAARAHALKNCLAVVRAVNRLLESDLSERDTVSIRTPTLLPDPFARGRSQAR
jgi:hypothetical protein